MMTIIISSLVLTVSELPFILLVIYQPHEMEAF